MRCTLCPRMCGAERTETRGEGFCRMPAGPVVARAGLHMWEEPVISGTRGSGTVFFSGCTLGCVFCQNHEISAQGVGKPVTVERLGEIFRELIRQGAHNINLVTPGHFAPWVARALEPALPVPVVCNTGGYETLESIERWRGYIDIWLADLKYVSPALSAELSAAPDYFAVARPGIEAMMAQAGHPVFDAEGILQKGVILRHLALPGALTDSLAVLDWMATLPKGSFIPSLMSQYTPFYKAKEMKPLDRRISTWEYRQVIDRAVELGLTEGYMKSEAKRS